MNLKNKKGFTMLELAITTLIIGIITAIALPNYVKAVERAKINTRIPMLRSLQNAIVAYYTEHEDYPTSFSRLSFGPGEEYTFIDGLNATIGKGNDLCVLSFRGFDNNSNAIFLECSKWGLYASVVNLTDNPSDGIRTGDIYFNNKAGGREKKTLDGVAASNNWPLQQNGLYLVQ